MNKLNSKTLYREMVEYYGEEYKASIEEFNDHKYGADKFYWISYLLRRTDMITPKTNASDIFAVDGKYILYNTITSLRLEAKSYKDLMAKLVLMRIEE